MTQCDWTQLSTTQLILLSQVEREIRIHSRLSHENIIQLYSAFEDDSNVYMVQEYATGASPAYCVLLLCCVVIVCWADRQRCW